MNELGTEPGPDHVTRKIVNSAGGQLFDKKEK